MRALVGRLLLVTALLASALVVQPAPASSQQAAEITLTPNCGPVGTSASQYSIRVDGRYFYTGEIPPPINIYFDDKYQGQTSAPSYGNTFSITIRPAQRAAGVVTVEARRTDYPTVSARFRIPCPSVSLSPSCGPAGAQTNVTVRGFSFGIKDSVTVDTGKNNYGSGRYTTDGKGTFSGPFTVVDPPSGTHWVTAFDPDDRWRATTTFTVPCPPGPTMSSQPEDPSNPPEDPSNPDDPLDDPPDDPPDDLPEDPPVVIDTTTQKPKDAVRPGDPTTTLTTIPPETPGVTLEVTPAIGPPGFVTWARGTGFVPGPVEIAWANGLGRWQVVAGADGTFVAPVLIFARDRVGPRKLVATAGDRSANDDFLVVPGAVQARNFRFRR